MRAASLLYHFVRASEHDWRDRKADRLGSLEVVHEYELGWLLHRQIRRFLTAKNAINILGRLPEVSLEVVIIGDKPTRRDRTSAAENGGQAIPSFHRYDEIFICPG
jgi:hypothetical protein